MKKFTDEIYDRVEDIPTIEIGEVKKSIAYLYAVGKPLEIILEPNVLGGWVRLKILDLDDDRNEVVSGQGAYDVMFKLLVEYTDVYGKVREDAK